MMDVYYKCREIEKPFDATLKLFREKDENKDYSAKKLVKLGQKLFAASRAFHELLEETYGYEPGNDSYGSDCPPECDEMSTALTAFATEIEAEIKRFNDKVVNK